MKIGLYSPYLDSFGGGERYILTAAEYLSSNNQVDVFLDQHLYSKNDGLNINLEHRFSLDLSKVNFIKAPIGVGSNFLQRYFFLKKYDLMFYLTDGSIFYSSAKKNILHFQAPLKVSVNGLWDKFKLSSWNLIVYNSSFTKENMDQSWGNKSMVVYPPVDVRKIIPLKKSKFILSVGRFAGFTKSKKHEQMIATFKKLFDSGQLKDWSLHLAGSLEGDKEYINELKNLAGNLPVNFYPDCPFQNLLKLYGESQIYWHAAGYGENDPAKMEHFGISTVEAMAAGAVPIVINKGGQTEIVENDKSGFLWNSLEELEELTIKLATDKNLFQELSKSAIARSRMFSKEMFIEKIKVLV